jgi:hypothetical protein
MANQVDTYARLVRQIRNDLRIQHPEWIQPNGQCPMCDSYEARLIELLSTAGGSNDNTVAVRVVPTLSVVENSMAANFS